MCEVILFFSMTISGTVLKIRSTTKLPSEHTSMWMAVRVRGKVNWIIWKRYLFNTTVKMLVAYL